MDHSSESFLPRHNIIIIMVFIYWIRQSARTLVDIEGATVCALVYIMFEHRVDLKSRVGVGIITNLSLIYYPS